MRTELHVLSLGDNIGKRVNKGEMRNGRCSTLLVVCLASLPAAPRLTTCIGGSVAEACR